MEDTLNGMVNEENPDIYHRCFFEVPPILGDLHMVEHVSKIMVRSMVVYRCRSRYGANHPVNVMDHLMVEGYGIINNVHNWIIMVVVTTCPL